MPELNPIFVDFCIFMAIISVLCSILVIYSHIKVPQLNKHPGQMIILICIVQIIFDAHWIGTIQGIKYRLKVSGFCKVFGCIFNLLVYLSWNILTFLAVELLIKLNRPLSTNYKLRFKVYIALTIVFTTIELSLTSWLGEYGLSALQTCFMVDGSPGYWIAMIPILINTPIILICLILLVRTKGYDKNKALHKVVLASISMIITWGLPTFTACIRTIFDVEIIALNYISFISGCLSGTLLAITRLGSKQILSRLFSVKRNEQSKSCSLKNFNEILIEESSISFFYNEYTENTIKSMLILLSMALIVYKECKENYCFGYKKKKFYTSKEKYEKVSKYLNISSLVQEKNGIWEYERDLFSNIRETCNITTQDLINSICSLSNFQKLQNENIGGRSGAFIFSTFDERFIIKTVTRNEKFFFLDILPAYTKRVTKHVDSKIVRIFGLFKILNTKQCFVIMENIIRIKETLAVFDLKGSTDNRYVKSEPGSSSVLKDINLEELKMRINIGQNEKTEVLKALNGDIKFFKKFNIIDYSLLVAFYEKYEKNYSRYYLEGVDGQAYCLGIIDFLQDYNLKKKIEVLLKRIKGQKNTSACSANKYSLRFLKFLENKLFD